jgi:hypothetical protein
MKQLTLRGFDKPLEARIRKLAREQRISLNRAALLLRRGGAGHPAPGAPPDVIGNSLDKYMGDWTAEEAAAFEKAVAIFEVVDPEAWE